MLLSVLISLFTVMAAGMKARFDKTSTSVSTLPIGCQICLDKVNMYLMFVLFDHNVISVWIYALL